MRVRDATAGVGMGPSSDTSSPAATRPTPATAAREKSAIPFSAAGTAWRNAPGGSATATNILRINPETGALIQSDGTVLRYNDSDTNDGEIPQLAAIAHSNNDIDATTTTLYGLEFTTQSLVRVTNAGVLTTLGVFACVLAMRLSMSAQRFSMGLRSGE
mgnify:CR=1 FL=1